MNHTNLFMSVFIANFWSINVDKSLASFEIQFEIYA